MRPSQGSTATANCDDFADGIFAQWPSAPERSQTWIVLGGTAFALTPALRESYVTGDAEELEYAAMADAARA